LVRIIGLRNKVIWLRIISTEVYRKYKDMVMYYSNSIQRDVGRGLSVTEIAKKLDLAPGDVLEILAVAEKDIPFEEWERADRFKARK
jgi:hypothetical protein